MSELWSTMSSSSKTFEKKQVATQPHGKGQMGTNTESTGPSGQYRCLEKATRSKRMEDPQKKETADPVDQTEQGKLTLYQSWHQKSFVAQGLCSSLSFCSDQSVPLPVPADGCCHTQEELMPVVELSLHSTILRWCRA